MLVEKMCKTFQNSRSEYDHDVKIDPKRNVTPLTHSFPMHPFSTTGKHFLMFSGDRERVPWEQMG